MSLNSVKHVLQGDIYNFIKYPYSTGQKFFTDNNIFYEDIGNYRCAIVSSKLITTLDDITDNDPDITLANNFVILNNEDTYSIYYYDSNGIPQLISSGGSATSLGLKIKSPVDYASTIALGTLSGALQVDGVIVSTGMRILVKNESTSIKNGIWIANSTSTWTRAIDAKTTLLLNNAYVEVENGTLKNTGWYTNFSGVIETDPIEWQQFKLATGLLGSYLEAKGLNSANEWTLPIDSLESRAILNSSKLITERGVYYGLPYINNSKIYNMSNYIYTPTTGGEIGKFLIGSGLTSTPVWSVPTIANSFPSGSILASNIQNSIIAVTGDTTLQILQNNGSKTTSWITVTGTNTPVYNTDPVLVHPIISGIPTGDGRLGLVGNNLVWSGEDNNNIVFHSGNLSLNDSTVGVDSINFYAPSTRPTISLAILIGDTIGAPVWSNTPIGNMVYQSTSSFFPSSATIPISHGGTGTSSATAALIALGGIGSILPGGAITATVSNGVATIAHILTAGYKHIPADGIVGQVLAYAGTSGQAVWYTPPWIQNVTTALGFTPYPATNPNGFISGINSSMIIASLGFTPYSTTNPSNFITGITASNITTALGYTPYSTSNPSGFITGINSSSVTTALGFTPYSNTNPNGYRNNDQVETTVSTMLSYHSTLAASTTILGHIKISESSGVLTIST